MWKLSYLPNLPWELSRIVEAFKHFASGKDSKSLRKASITSMKAFTEALVVVTSMEAFVEAFVDACVEDIFVEDFKSSVSSIEAFV